MLKDILGVVEKVNTRPLLITFLALSMTTFLRAVNLLAEPLSWYAVLLPFFVLLAYGLVWSWISFVHNLNAHLADSDITSWGPIIGCSLLAFCMLIAFSFLSSHPQGISFALLAAPNFIRVCALILLSVETIKISR